MIFIIEHLRDGGPESEPCPTLNTTFDSKQCSVMWHAPRTLRLCGFLKRQRVPHFSRSLREVGLLAHSPKWVAIEMQMFIRHRNAPQLRVLFLHALGLEALLRHGRPAFHHLELLST